MPWKRTRSRPVSARNRSRSFRQGSRIVTDARSDPAQRDQTTAEPGAGDADVEHVPDVPEPGEQIVEGGSGHLEVVAEAGVAFDHQLARGTDVLSLGKAENAGVLGDDVPGPGPHHRIGDALDVGQRRVAQRPDDRGSLLALGPSFGVGRSGQRPGLARMNDDHFHVRIVGLFSVMAAVPAILLALVASITLDRGLDRWFSVTTCHTIRWVTFTYRSTSSAWSRYRGGASSCMSYCMTLPRMLTLLISEVPA